MKKFKNVYSKIFIMKNNMGLHFQKKTLLDAMPEKWINIQIELRVKIDDAVSNKVNQRIVENMWRKDYEQI